MRAAGAPARRRPFLAGSRLISLILFLVFLLVVLEGLRYPPEARLFPTIIGAAGMALSLAVFVLHGGDDGPAEEHAAAPAPDRLRRLLAIAAAPVYSLLVWTVGFYAASLIAILLLPQLLGYRRPILLAAIAVVSVGVIAAVFSWGMAMAMPPGILGNWILTTFVYER